jgi:hypothetical protein
MSDTHAATHDATVTSELFEKSELQQFVSDDQEAGRAICKMLSALFVYTLFAMSVAASWTYYSTL